MSLTIVISHSPVQVGVGFTTIFNQFVVLFVNPFRLKNVRSIDTFDRSREEEAKGRWFAARLRRWKSMGTFLDVGCATGFFLHGIKTHSAWEVYGTEFGESAVQFARERLGLNVTQGNLVDAHFPEAFFDYVHVNNVLEHVLDPMA